MKEFTERHHAFIAASFYQQLTLRFGERGEQAFVLATQRYAEQRGSRMAQRAIRDGKPLTFAVYREYGEWAPTRTAVEEGSQNVSEVVSYAPDYEVKIHQCPWAIQFKEMGVIRGGTVYCTHLDKAIVRGFNPYLTFETKQSLHECPYCIQVMEGANFKEGQEFPRSPANVRGFDYHCGHCYKTFREIAVSIFGQEGEEASAKVLALFGENYGREMADRILDFRNVDFNVM